MKGIFKIALAVVVISIAVGTVFGLLVQSSSLPSRSISFSSEVYYVPGGFACPPVAANYSEWLQIDVGGNRTTLNLDTVTLIDPGTRITLTMPLNSSVSAFVSYDPLNSTFESISVPLPDYWSPSINLDISLSYYFSGSPPTSYSFGAIPIFQKATLSC